MLRGRSLAPSSDAFGCLKLAPLLEIDIGCPRSEPPLCLAKVNSWNRVLSCRGCSHGDRLVTRSDRSHQRLEISRSFLVSSDKILN